MCDLGNIGRNGKGFVPNPVPKSISEWGNFYWKGRRASPCFAALNCALARLSIKGKIPPELVEAEVLTHVAALLPPHT
jgi:hypothetical protein